MKKIVLLFFVFGSIGFLTAQKSTISSATVSFTFVSKDVDGSISGFESSSSIDLENLTSSEFRGSVNVESIKTGNFLRDWSLKGSKYFDADEHPKITFESSEILQNQNGYSVKGALQIKGISKPVTIDFKKKGNQLIGTTTLFSSDFDIAIKDERNENKVTVNIILNIDR